MVYCYKRSLKRRFRRFYLPFSELFDKKENPDEFINTTLEKTFRDRTYYNKDEFQIKEEELVGYRDKLNVCAIIPKNKVLRQFIDNNFQVEPDRKVVDVIANKKWENKVSEVNISRYFLNIFFNLSKIYDQTKIRVYEKDFPIYLETDEFIMIIAPRVPKEDSEEVFNPFIVKK